MGGAERSSTLAHAQTGRVNSSIDILDLVATRDRERDGCSLGSASDYGRREADGVVFFYPAIFPGGAAERGGASETPAGPRGDAVVAEQRSEACGATFPQVEVKQGVPAWDREY